MCSTRGPSASVYSGRLQYVSAIWRRHCMLFDISYVCAMERTLVCMILIVGVLLGLSYLELLFGKYGIVGIISCFEMKLLMWTLHSMRLSLRLLAPKGYLRSWAVAYPGLSDFGVTVFWTPPLQGWLKLNFDGASKGEGRLPYSGGVLRDNCGQWVTRFVDNWGSGSVLMAEL
ncbi:hypothetical protein GH714_039192 [Hevea brasiliensis]|uniref:RNase H type-1 domain-containing protein n=1 Tax=Hevea brasiliensis TaxID=3981 RepID=A0A6A6KPC9_HEVBR|nr:hypothetical protein GH714_039192 [Hevea brasiliensis]